MTTRQADALHDNGDGDPDDGAALLQQHEPLLGTSVDEVARNSPSMLRIYRQNALFAADARALTIQSFGLLFVVLVWLLVFQSIPLRSFSLFGLHPLVQSFTFLVLLQGIVTLQPTSLDNEPAKRAAFHVHRWLNLLLVLPLFTVGASIMWHLHGMSGARHFISWHGILGTLAVAWAWMQVGVGILIGVRAGHRWIGGEGRAKSLYKWHRASGYALFLLFAFVLFLGAAQTSWAEQNATLLHNALVALSLLAVVCAMALRVQGKKMPFASSSSTR